LDVSTCQLKTGEIAEHFGVKGGSKAFDQLRSLLQLLTEQGVIACQQKRRGSPRYYWSIKTLIRQAKQTQQEQQTQVPLPVPAPQPQALTELAKYRELADEVYRLRRAFDESEFQTKLLQAQHNEAAKQLQALKALYLKGTGL
jgi:predicted transcriptional regulator